MRALPRLEEGRAYRRLAQPLSAPTEPTEPRARRWARAPRARLVTWLCRFSVAAEDPAGSSYSRRSGEVGGDLLRGPGVRRGRRPRPELGSAPPLCWLPCRSHPEPDRRLVLP